jgi:exosortase
LTGISSLGLAKALVHDERHLRLPSGSLYGTRGRFAHVTPYGSIANVAETMMQVPSIKYGLWSATAVLLCVAGWVYWPVFRDLSEAWARDPQYSHGFIVPLFAIAILVLRKNLFDADSILPSWWSVPALLLGGVAFLIGSYYYSPWLAEVSLLPILAGIALALGGMPLLRWSWPAILFLAFMIPLPHRLDQAMVGPLKRVATAATTNALQTFGILAEAEGNIIVLPDGDEMGVAEACSGLRMLMVFVATSVAIAFVINRSLLQRVLIVLSSFPIAIICNVFRITATGIVHETVGREFADHRFHDLAGWLMSPLALVMLCGELWVLSRLLIPANHDMTPMAIHRRTILKSKRVVGQKLAGVVKT